MKKLCALFLALVLMVAPCTALAAGGYQDVPTGNWSVSVVQAAREYGLMSGTAPGIFGFNQTISRAEFVTVLARMFQWDTSATTSGFTDTKGHWAEGYLAAAVQHGAIDKGGAFRPNEAITREDMAVMLVRALGYQSVAEAADAYSIPFTDVTTHKGYITVAYDIGMTNGVSPTQFAPHPFRPAGRGAAMLVRIYEKYTAKTDWLHGF